MKLRKREITIALILLAICGYLYFRHFGQKPPKSGITYEEILEQDRTKLQQSQPANEGQIIAALVRLGEIQNPLALSRAKEFTNSHNEKLRAAAAEVFGSFTTAEATESLKKLIADPSTLVRSLAIRALAQSTLTDRKALLKQLIQQDKLSPIENIEARGVLSKSIKDEKELELNAREIILATTRLKTRNELFEALNILSSIEMRQKIDYINKFMRNTLYKSKDPELQAFALRQLATYDADNFRHEIGHFLESKEVNLRSAAVQSISLACPSERIIYLQTLLDNEANDLIWQKSGWVLLSFSAPETSEIIHNLSQRHWSPDRQMIVNSWVGFLREKNKVQDPCVLKYPNEFKNGN